MGQLAKYIKNQFDNLARLFVQGLNAVPFYQNIPEQVKLGIAHTYLNLTIGSLETRDISQLARFLQTRAQEVLAQGFSADALLQALNVYEEIIWPLVDSAEDAQFLGLATSRLRDVVSREIAAQLIRSEREFHDLFERLPIGILRFTADGQVVQSNPAFLRLVGYDSIATLNQVGVEALFQNSADLERLMSLLGEGPVVDQEFAFRDAAGQTIWISLSAGLVLGPQGQIVEAIVQEIGERKLAEERSRRRLSQLRTLTELTVQLSAEKDPDMFCKQAVELGRERLGVDRLAIWLNDGPPGHFRGTWGTDEQGHTRDERHARLQINADSNWGRLATGDLTEEVTYEKLRDHLGNPVGEGWHISVPVVGEQGNVFGVLVADQLLSGREWDDYVVEVLRLYGLLIGRLLERASMLETLARSQQMLRLIMDNVPQAVFWKGRNLVYLGCNRVYAEGKGLPDPEMVVGKTDYDFSPPEQAERFRADDLEVMVSGHPKLNYEELLIMPTGERRWLRTSKIPLQDTAGNVFAVLGMYEDITARKEIELELERLARAVEATRDAVIITDLDGKITFVNPAFEQITGYTAAEVIGKNPRIIKSGMQEDALYSEMWQTITAGRPWSGELINRRKDGTLYNAQLSISPILGKNGQVEQFVAIQRDVTEQHKAEQAVRQAQQMLRLIVDTLPEMIFWKDRRSVYLGCNRRFAQAAGYETPEKIIGQTDYDMAWTREQSDAFVRDDREVMESGKPKLHILEQQLQADGRRVWLETNKVPLFDEQGHVIGVLGAAVDVTERMEALEAARTAQRTLQAVIDNIPQQVFWKDRNLVFLGCNAAFASAARLNSPAEIVGKTDYDLWWADMAEQFRADDRAVIESGQPVINREITHKMSERKGEWWTLQNKIPLRDETGQIWAVMGTVENITERKLTEIRLRQNEARLTLALEAAHAGVWEMRPQSDEVYFDVRWFALLGYGPDELPQAYETWASLLHPEERVTVEEQIQRYIQQGVDFELDFRMRAKSGDYRWIHSIAKVIARNPDGSAAHLVGTHIDITEVVQHERERAELYERRTEEVRLSTQVAQEIAAAPSLEELFVRVVTLIKERFGYYHAQIFRYDPEFDAMVLVAGYGEVGARMLAAGHRLPRGVGLVGTAAETGQTMLVTDTSADPNWQPNPNLPETRGELAVPIRWRDQVLGILDVQSDRAGELDQDDQLVLEGLCGQIAIAIQSTQAIQEAQTFRRLVESAGQGIGIATLDGRIYYANKALLDIVEAEPGAFLGHSLLEYAAEHERQRLMGEILPQVMQGESWQGELVARSTNGRLVPTLHNLFLLHDDQGRPRFLADVVTDVTESKRVQAEMQDRLQELNTLYRQISEQGWQAFREQGALSGGYLYDGAETRRADELWLPEMAEAVNAGDLVVTTYEEPVAVAPLSVPGGETVGVLGVFDDPASPLLPEDLELVEQVAAEVAQALEGARLSLQTQSALAETGLLYQASAALNAAQTFDEIVDVLRHYTEIGEADLNVSINLFNRPWVGDDVPEWSQVLARWTQLEASATLPRYPLRAFPSAKTLLKPDQPTVIEDVWTDERMDPVARNLYGKQFRGRSTFFVPLVVAGSWIGYVNAIFSQPRKFSPDSLRRITALVNQAAIVIQSIQRLQETQARAQREQLLREISARLRAQPDVEGVLRVLARELGQVVGRRTFVSVSNLEALTEAIGALTAGDSGGGNGHGRAAAEEGE